MAEGIYIDDKFSQTTDLLRHLIENSNQMPLILGEPGTGKTTLLNHLAKLAAEQWKLCLVEATSMLQPYQFFACLGHCFDVSDERPGLEKLVHCFENLNRRGRLPIIIVDDAHQLPIATIIMLLRLYERHPNDRLLVKIVLFAQPQIDLLLKSSQIQAMNLHMIQALELYPLSKDRMQHFIQFLIQRMDFADSFKISQSQLNGIYRTSGGNQAKIVSTLHQLQNRAVDANLHKKGRHSLLANLSAPSVIGGILIVALVLTAVVFQDEINALFAERTEVVTTPQTIDKVIETVPSDTSLSASPLPESHSIAPAVNEPLADNSIGQGPALEPKHVAEAPAINQTEKPGVIEQPMISELPAEQLSQSTGKETGQPSGDREISHTTEAQPETRTIGEDNSEIIEAVSILNKGGTLIPHKPLKRITKAPIPEVSSTKSTLSGKPDNRLKAPLREEWLIAQQPTSYTLQIVGLRSEEGVKKFLKKHQLWLSTNVAYFRTMKDGTPWFSVVFGVYPDSKSAMAAVKALPKALQQSDVWPRSFKSIRQLLRKR